MVVKIASEQLLRRQIKELRKDTDFLSTLLESLMGHAIVAADLDGDIIAYNEGAHKIYGYAPEEIIGKQNIEIFFPSEFVAGGNLQRIIDNLMKTGKFSCDEDKLRKNGEHFPARILFVLTSDKTGKTDGFIEIAEDLTERKRLENRWWDSMSNFYKVVNNSADGIIITNGEGIVRFANPAAGLLFGRRREAFQGEHFGFPITSGETTEIEIIRKAGETVTAEMRVVATNWFDEIAYLATLRDITERKKAQQAQERLSQQLKEKVSELETFSYGIAHDLRSPLVSIEGFSRLLREDIQNQKLENVQEDIRLLESGVKRMQGFLSSTLEYSRAGRLIKRTANVSFSEIVNEALTDYNQQIKAIGATVSKAKSFPRVNVDRSMIIEVMANLIQNCIKYRDESVPLKIEIDYESSNGGPVFFVRDNGIGISADEVNKVFEIFYRGTSHVEGSGIGLKIVKKIIEAHGGKIWVKEAHSGKGTTVCFTLPEPNGIDKGKNNGED
jgi:PAS domain S-box-containing protein